MKRERLADPKLAIPVKRVEVRLSPGRQDLWKRLTARLFIIA